MIFLIFFYFYQNHYVICNVMYNVNNVIWQVYYQLSLCTIMLSSYKQAFGSFIKYFKGFKPKISPIPLSHLQLYGQRKRLHIVKIKTAIAPQWPKTWHVQNLPGNTTSNAQSQSGMQDMPQFNDTEVNNSYGNDMKHMIDLQWLSSMLLLVTRSFVEQSVSV